MKSFIILMAFLMALVALSIDAMLPALGTMAADLGVARPNDIQLVVGLLFLGLTLGQLIYGPLSDSIGRKPTLYAGITLFAIGSLVSWHAPNLGIMLFGRFLQGLGVAAPRIVVTAIVRDKFHGRDMASVMSLVMGVFILVPAIAPAVGQVIIHGFGWRAIFIFYAIASIAALLWTHLQLAETLAPANRRPLNLRSLWQGIREVARNRITLGYTMCSGLAFGTLIAYLNSAQQIFHELFQVGDLFALYFGLLALAIGAAFFTNSALVRRHGMRKLTGIALRGLVALCTLFAAYSLLAPPSLLVFMLFASAAFFCLGLTFGNLNAMALEPMGHMAGLASAFMGSLSTAISLCVGTVIGQLYDGTLMPIAMGFLALSTSAWLIMRRTAQPTPQE